MGAEGMIPPRHAEKCFTMAKWYIFVSVVRCICNGRAVGSMTPELWWPLDCPYFSYIKMQESRREGVRRPHLDVTKRSY